MKKKRAWFFGIVGTVLIVAFGGAIFAISCIPTASDNARFTSLLNDVERHFKFTVMVEGASRPAVYGAGLAYSDHIDIRGEYNDTEVDEILAAISGAQARRSDKKPIEVRFFAKDNGREEPYKEVTIRR